MKYIKYLSISMLLLLASCAIVQPLEIQPLEENFSKEEILSAIRPGYKIEILTKTGDQYLIKVSSITDDNITGDGKKIKLEDIERIEIKRFSEGMRAGVVIGGLVFAYILSLIFDSLIVIELL
jgi:hypothetical protein